MNPLDEKVEEDTEVTAQLEKYKQEVNEEYLKQFGYTFDPVSYTHLDVYKRQE